MKFIRNQKGFTGLEIALVVVAIGAIGTAGYFAFEARSNEMAKKEPVKQEAPAPKTEEKKDPYAGWKTFTSKVNGLTFKYPANWKVDVALQSDGSYKQENGSIVSPDGFNISLLNPPDGLGGGCDDPCPIIKTYSAEKLSQFSKDTYLVKIHTYSGVDNSPETRQIGLFSREQKENTYDPSLTSYQGFPPYLIFSAGDSSVLMMGSYDDTNPKNTLDPKQYFDLPDLKNAELILKSVKVR